MTRLGSDEELKENRMNLPTQVLVSGLLLAVAARRVSASEGTLGKSVWGGDSAILEVVEGGANLEFDCARGRIEGPIRIDGHGDFDAPGTFTPEGPGPTRDDDSSASKVRYQGHVKGETLQLTVRTDKEQIGSHTLTRDRQPILRKCR
jgi:hypothetical protein